MLFHINTTAIESTTTHRAASITPDPVAPVRVKPAKPDLFTAVCP